MKKSNKLLMGGFLSLVLLITALHITLYAKYKSGDYTVYHTETKLRPELLQSFPQILFVTVKNIPNATVKFSDVAGVEKENKAVLDYVQKGDTLLITGKDDISTEFRDMPITFYMPGNATLSAVNSSLSFEAEKEGSNINPIINLQKSIAFFSAKNRFLLGNIKIMAADSSSVIFRGKTDVAQLEVQLSNSSIEYGEGNLGQLSLLTDSLSRVSFQSKHLLKANIKTIDRQ